MGERTSWPLLLWLGVFAAIGTYAIRGVAWWPLGAAAAIAGTLVTQPAARSVETPDPPLIRRLNLVLAGAIIAVCVVLLPVWRPVDTQLGAPVGVVGDAPPGVTAALRELAVPGDRVFNQQAWGSWLEFAFPDALVAIDSRIELFPVAVWDAYQRVIAGVDGWERQLDEWGVTIAVVDADEDAFAARLTGAGWRSAYTDEDGHDPGRARSPGRRMTRRPSDRTLRMLSLVATATILGIAVAEVVGNVALIEGHGGEDFAIYLRHTREWLAGGSFYDARH